MKRKISICIPTTEMIYSDGTTMGVIMLKFLFNTISTQTFKDFEIIIADQAQSDIIKDECEKWSEFDLKYYKNDKNIGSAAANTNFAISKATGDYIKIMFQDDFFHNQNALEYLVNNIGNYSWGALGAYHCNENDTDNIFRPFLPRFDNPVNILCGGNTVSGPSVTWFKNDDNYFDENLCYLNDTELFYQLYLKYGNPFLANDYFVVQRLRKDGVSSNMPQQIINEEVIYVQVKHKIIGGSLDLNDYPNMNNRLINIRK
jgi:glycosyltransferase involved in cell wall biosynthesis